MLSYFIKGIILHGNLIQRSIVVKKWTLTTEASLSSDIHLGYAEKEEVLRIVEKEEVDMVLLTSDQFKGSRRK